MTFIKNTRNKVLNYWTEEEQRFLLNNVGKIPFTEVLKHFSKRSESSVKAKCTSMGLSYRK